MGQIICKGIEYVGGGGSEATYEAGDNINISENNVISAIIPDTLASKDYVDEEVAKINLDDYVTNTALDDAFDSIIGWHELVTNDWDGDSRYISESTDVICHIGSREFSKKNSEKAVVAYGKCSITNTTMTPIIISPSQNGSRYIPSDDRTMYTLDYLGIKWYITAYDYAIGGSDMQEGYGIRLDSPASTVNEAGAQQWALAVLQAANVHLVGRRSIQTQIDNINSVKLSTEGHTDGAIRFGITEDGQYGYYKVGADTVTPFKTGGGETKGLKKNFNCSGKVAFDNDGTMTLEPNGDNNIITIPFRPGDRSWKMETKLNLRNIYNFNTIFGVTASVHPPIVCEFNSSSQIKLWLTSPTTDYTRSLTGTHVYQTGEDIWIRIGYKDQIYFIEYSDDGINYIRDASLNDPVTIKDSEENIICIGGCYGSYQNTVRGIIYLQDTHLYIDDEIWW